MKNVRRETLDVRRNTSEGAKPFVVSRLPSRVSRFTVVLATAAAAYGMVFLDVSARGREAFRRGETYMRWHEHPDEKQAFYEEKFRKEQEALARRRERKEISEEDYAQDLEILRFDRDQAVNES